MIKWKIVQNWDTNDRMIVNYKEKETNNESGRELNHVDRIQIQTIYIIYSA